MQVVASPPSAPPPLPLQEVFKPPGLVEWQLGFLICSSYSDCLAVPVTLQIVGLLVADAASRCHRLRRSGGSGAASGRDQEGLKGVG